MAKKKSGIRKEGTVISYGDCERIMDELSETKTPTLNKFSITRKMTTNIIHVVYLVTIDATDTTYPVNIFTTAKKAQNWIKTKPKIEQPFYNIHEYEVI